MMMMVMMMMTVMMVMIITSYQLSVVHMNQNDSPSLTWISCENIFEKNINKLQTNYKYAGGPQWATRLNDLIKIIVIPGSSIITHFSPVSKTFIKFPIKGHKSGHKTRPHISCH